MALKTGDIVKFLDEEGGGIVTKISGNLILVKTEDGFEIPTPASKLIKVDEPKNASEQLFTPNFNIDNNNDSKEVKIERQEKNSAILRSAKEFDKGIYFIFVPKDQKLLINGDIEIKLVNHSSSDILFSFFLKGEDNEYLGMDYNAIRAGKMHTIETISREQLAFWLEGKIQILLHKDRQKMVLNPLDIDFNIKGSKFYNELNYISNGFVFERAFVWEVIKENSFNSVAPKSRTRTKETKQPKQKQIQQTTMIDKHIIDDGSAEVDLHIEKLSTDHSKLMPEHIMSIQLDYFSRCLEAAMQKDIKKVVFIHGVGVGRLKMEIAKILDKYDLTYEDASIAKYGIGATEINF